MKTFEPIALPKHLLSRVIMPVALTAYLVGVAAGSTIFLHSHGSSWAIVVFIFMAALALAVVAFVRQKAASLLEPRCTSERLGYEAITAEAERQIRRQLSFLLAHGSHTSEVWTRIKAQCFFQAEGVLHLWESLSKGVVLNEDLTRLQRLVFVDIKDASCPMQPTNSEAAGDHRGGA